VETERESDMSEESEEMIEMVLKRSVEDGKPTKLWIQTFSSLKDSNAVSNWRETLPSHQQHAIFDSDVWALGTTLSLKRTPGSDFKVMIVGSLM
jgi:hypothetical protein